MNWSKIEVVSETKPMKSILRVTKRLLPLENRRSKKCQNINLKNKWFIFQKCAYIRRIGLK
jgi:hypothetical protein